MSEYPRGCWVRRAAFNAATSGDAWGVCRETHSTGVFSAVKQPLDLRTRLYAEMRIIPSLGFLRLALQDRPGEPKGGKGKCYELCLA